MSEAHKSNQCEICERYCYNLYTKTIGPSPDLKYCFDCWCAWYDASIMTSEDIKTSVIKTKGMYGGQALTEDDYNEFVLGNTLIKTLKDLIDTKNT